ncbi:MAG: 1-acyl-sn-glycerol-3-phosphate acyltransferase [Clostridia bacterium]|nr:1-acyl-sn-glycerol-3-phosphate acyltransferase [Clostridia bacterium]
MTLYCIIGYEITGRRPVVLKEGKTIFYTDEQNDEFSAAVIKPIKIDKNYRYDRTRGMSAVARFFFYRIVATPLAFIYCKAFLHYRCVSRKVLKPFRKKGFYLYGNHTSNYGDPLMPNLFAFPENVYFIVHPNNVSMPVLGFINRFIGAIPLPDDIDAAKNFSSFISERIDNGDIVAIYPEAHIWPYYTKIRNFSDKSFGYPARSGKPVFCFTNTYQKRFLFGKELSKPKIVTYIDGPFYPDMELTLASRKKDLRDRVFDAMCRRAEKSDKEYIRYIKKGTD